MAKEPREQFACPNRPLNLTMTAKGLPTHASCPSVWLCEKRGCQLKLSAENVISDKLFDTMFGRHF